MVVTYINSYKQVVIALGRPSQKRLERILVASTNDEVNYEQVNGTRNEQLPARYSHLREQILVGQGAADFVRAREGIRAWAAHRGIHARITPPAAPISTATTVIVSIPMGPVSVIAPCRIVDVTDEFDQFGFAYGTLPGHPERGEERFIVHLTDSGDVLFEVTAFSRPHALTARLAGPLANYIQQRATRGYLLGMQKFVQAT